MALSFLLVDDHQLFRQALTSLIRHLPSQPQVFGVSTLEEAEALLASESSIQVVLLDVSLGLEGSSLWRLPQLLQRWPHLRVVVVSGSDDLATVHQAVAHGALGFVSKAESFDQLEQVLEAVLQGQVVLPSRVYEHLAPHPPELTARQLDIATALLKSYTTKRMALELGISPETVKSHIKTLMSLWGVHSRTELVVRFAQAGLKLPFEREQ